jgi:hypothetical protein
MALVATNTTEIISIMNEFGAKYLITYQSDSTIKTRVFLRSAGLNQSDYLVYDYNINPYSAPSSPEPTALGRQTMVFRIWLGQDVPGLNLVYSDVYTRIYKIA